MKLRKLVVGLASFESVREAAAEVNAYSEPVDVRKQHPFSLLNDKNSANLFLRPHQKRWHQYVPLPPSLRPPSSRNPHHRPQWSHPTLSPPPASSPSSVSIIQDTVFTTLFRPRLLASSSPRVVNVSSRGHRLSDIRHEDPGFSQRYDKWQAYGQSKTANILFAVGLVQKWGIEAFSVYPGGA